MPVQRWRNLRLTGRKPGSKSLVFDAEAADPTTRSRGISRSPPKARPSRPAALSAGSIDCRRRDRPVRIERTERRKARNRAASKSSSALTLSKRKRLEQRQLGLGVEEVQAPRIEAETDLVTGLDAHARVDSRGDLVAADLPVEELVRAQPFHHVHLHLHGGAAVCD